MIYHPRSEWVTTEPVTGPPMPWADIDTIVVHYGGIPNLIDGDPGERWDRMPEFIRAIHEDYLTNRKPKGYSIGYNVGVDARGHGWELRGWDIKAAATLGHNDHTFAIIIFVDGQDEATPEAVATVRELVAEAERLAGRTLAIRGHRDFIATQCPGTGIYRQIAEGVFRAPAPVPPPVTPPPVTPPTVPPQEDTVVKLIVRVPGDTNRAEALVLMDGAGTEMIGFASVADRNTIVGALGITPIDISAAQYDDFVRHTGDA